MVLRVLAFYEHVLIFLISVVPLLVFLSVSEPLFPVLLTLSGVLWKLLSVLNLIFSAYASYPHTFVTDLGGTDFLELKMEFSILSYRGLYTYVPL